MWPDWVSNPGPLAYESDALTLGVVDKIRSSFSRWCLFLCRHS